MRSKAIFLLVIFMLNTIVGFSCSLFVEEDHHDDKSHNHHHAGFNEEKIKLISGLSISKEDPCCKTLVNDLLTQGKLIPKTVKVIINLPVIWLQDYSYTLLFQVESIKLNHSVYAGRRYRPPNWDIRIAIQSFQI